MDRGNARRDDLCWLALALSPLPSPHPRGGVPTTIPPACSNTRRSTTRRRAFATVIGPPGKRKTRPANAPAAPVTITASGAIRGRNHADAKWSPAPTHERHDGPPGCLGSASGHGQYTGVSLTTKMTCQQPSAGFRGFKLECDVTRWARGIRCDEPLRAESGPTGVASGSTGVRAIAVVSLRARKWLHRPKRKLL